MRRPGSSFVLAALFLFMGSVFSAEARAESRIGILMFSEETRYNDAARGIMDKLKEEGFGGPTTRFVIENAGGNKAKAAELVRKFAAPRMDLIFTLGTSATIAVAREIKDVPVVFSMVFDPVEAGVAKDWKSSGNNTTGVTSQVPMSELMGYLKKLAPAERLAVLYTPGEKNSETQLKVLQGLQADFKIKVVPVPLVAKEEVALILPDVVRTSDAVFVTGSNLVDSQISVIVEMAVKARVVTVSHLEDLVRKGVLLGVCVNSYRNGRLAGEKAVSVLKGAKPSSIPIEPLKQYDVMLNMKTARAGQFRIPEAFLRTVDTRVE